MTNRAGARYIESERQAPLSRRGGGTTHIFYIADGAFFAPVEWDEEGGKGFHVSVELWHASSLLAAHGGTLLLNRKCQLAHCFLHPLVPEPDHSGQLKVLPLLRGTPKLKLKGSTTPPTLICTPHLVKVKHTTGLGSGASRPVLKGEKKVKFKKRGGRWTEAAQTAQGPHGR